MRDLTIVSQHVHLSDEAHVLAVDCTKDAGSVCIKMFEKCSDFSIYMSSEQAENLLDHLRDLLTAQYNHKLEGADIE